MQTRPRIALTVIARDEEDNLADLAASVSGQVDEMVLLDTGSVDGTVERARELGFIVGHRPWTDSFAEARNAAWELTDASWLLTLDCDERLVVEPNSPTLHQIVAQAQAAGASGCIVEGINLEDYGRQSMFRSARLHRREGQHWVGRVHEQVEPTVEGTVVSYVFCPSVKFIHSGYLSEVMVRRNKQDRNLDLAQKMYDDNPEVPSAIRALALARAHGAANSSHSIITKYCDEALMDPSALGSAGWSWALTMRVRIYKEEGNLDMALQLLQRQSEAVRCALVSLQTAQMCYDMDRYEQARVHLSLSRQLPKTTPYSPEEFDRDCSLLEVKLIAAEGRVVDALDELIRVSAHYSDDPYVVETLAAVMARMPS